MQPFFQSLCCILFIFGVAKSKMKDIKFYSSVGISSRPVAFLIVKLVSTTFSSSSVNYSSSLSINNFYDRFFSDFRGVSKQIYEMFFSKCVFVLLSYAIGSLFYVLTSFPVCHVYDCDCLFSSVFLFLLI